MLGVDDPREENARLGNDGAPWLEEKSNTEGTDDVSDHFCVGLARCRTLTCITHAEAATDIQNFQDDTLLAQVEQVSGEALQRAAEWSKFDNLRTDMSTDSLPADGLCVSMLEIKFARFGPGHAEFVVLQAGGDVRVAPSFYIRIHADGDAGRLSMHAAR